MIFDMAGKLLAKIQSEGRGPDELPTFRGYFLDRFLGKICIAYPPRNQIYIYNLDGTLDIVEEFDDKIWHHFTKDSSGCYAFLYNNSLVGWDNADLMLYSGGKQTNKFLSNRPFLETLAYHNIQNPIIAYDEASYFLRWMDHFIYRLEGDRLSKAFYFDFGSRRFPSKSADLSLDENLNIELDGLPSSIEGLFITDDFVYFHFVIKGRLFPCYFDKSSGKLYRVAEYGFNGGTNLIPDLVVGSTDEYFIYRLSALNFKKQIQVLTNSYTDTAKMDQMSELIHLDANTEVNDNSFLLFYKPKF